MPGPRTLLAALAVIALLAAGCGSDETAGEQAGAVAIPVAQAVRAEPGTEVVVEARAYPYGQLGYALVGEEAAVFVAALPTEVAKVQAGEVLRVQGDVQRIGAGLAESIANARDDAGFAAQDPALASLSLEVGAPLIINPSATGEGNDTSPARDDAGSPD